MTRCLIFALFMMLAGCGASRPTRGDLAALSLQTLDGQRISLQSEIGELTFVTFWASWCKSCKLELDALNYLGSLHYHQGVKIIGVSIDETREAARAAAFRKDLAFINLFVDENKSIQNAFRVRSVPVTVVLDNKGNAIQFPDPETGVLCDNIPGLKPWGNALSTKAVREALETVS